MKTLTLLFSGLFFTIFCFGQASPQLAISKISQPPLIDGIITTGDPWTESWISINKRNTNWSSTDDMTGRFQMIYDDDYLYLLTHVTDPTLDTSNYTEYCNDYIQVFVKMDTNSINTGGEYSIGDWYFFQKRASVFPNGFGPYTLINADFTKDSEFKIVQAVSDSDYY